MMLKRINKKNKGKAIIYCMALTVGLLSLYIFNFTQYKLETNLIFYYNGVFTVIMAFLTKSLMNLLKK